MTNITYSVNESSDSTIPLGFVVSERSHFKTEGWLMCVHRFVVTHQAVEPTISTARSITDVISKREANPARREALARARLRLGASLANSEGVESLTSLRLAKGLSQAELADLIGQQQPYIAKIEKGNIDLRVSTVIKLAKALDISAEKIIALTRANHD